MLRPKINLPSDQRKLLRLYNGLDDQARESLVAFAEFLGSRDGGGTLPEPRRPAEPKPIPRPDSESVIGAIRRLSESYYMVDKSLLLTETSSLMTAHLMHGREAAEVIDELEALFARHFQEHHASSPG